MIASTIFSRVFGGIKQQVTYDTASYRGEPIITELVLNFPFYFPYHCRFSERYLVEDLSLGVSGYVFEFECWHVVLQEFFGNAQCFVYSARVSRGLHIYFHLLINRC